MSEAKLRRELDDAFKNRAHLYRLMLDELRGRLGEDEAERVLSEVCLKRGQEIAPLLFAGMGPTDACRIGLAFLAVSPDDGRLYPNTATPRADGISIQVHRCPLKDAWNEAGLAPGEIARLCRIAGAFDKGLFEATGIRFEAQTWREGGGSDCCHIHLTDAVR